MTCYVTMHPYPDAEGRVGLCAYWSDFDGVFRPEPSPEDNLPTGYRRCQYFLLTPEEAKTRFGHEAKHHRQATELAWPPLTEEQRNVAAASLRHVLDNTGIVGDARRHTENALAWLGGSPS